MASLVRDKNGTHRVLWVEPDGRRRNMRLGAIARRGAETIKEHVQALVDARRTGGSPSPPTALWLARVDPAFREKLAAAGLIEGPRRSTLGAFLEAHILSRTDVKPATLEIWSQPCRNLITFFGALRSLRTITPGNAEEFKAWLKTQDPPLAPATVAKRLSFARTFLHVARKHRYIEENPFAELKIPGADVSARQSFVSRETIQRILAVASPQWRTIVALCRFGGLRCPSEVLSLEWSHVDWEKGWLIVPSPKTARHAGQASRKIPLYGELEPFLREAWELASDGQTHVVGGELLAKADTPGGWRSINLRTSFERLLRRAGVETWPRLFHNLRASWETELLEKAPLHVVAKWMGHSTKIAVKHYAQTTDEHFERFAVRGARTRNRTHSGAYSRTHGPRSPEVAEGEDSPQESTDSTLGDLPRLSASHINIRENGEGGIRTPSENMEVSGGVYAQSYSPRARGELDLELEEVARAWSALDTPIRQAILTLVRSSRG
jgi:integrase